MAASIEPQTPEEEAALRELAATRRRRHRWLTLFWSVTVSVHTTIILHMIWHDWPLDARDLGPLAFFVVNALGGLGWLAWGLRAVSANRLYGFEQFNLQNLISLPNAWRVECPHTFVH